MADYDFDVALSFAGEDREYVEKVAKYLTALDIRVFYDRLEEIELWGKNLYLYLDEVYRRRAQYCVVFISRHYKEKAWTRHEIRSVLARALISKDEYILPARFDDTELEGLNPADAYISLEGKPPEVVGYVIARKIGKANYLDATLACCRNWLGSRWVIEIDGDMVTFECESEDYYNEFPIRLLVDMYKLDQLERMFLDTGILVQ